MKSNDKTIRSILIPKLSNWLVDNDLAGVRNPAELNKLPIDEKKEWLALWDEVSTLIKRIEEK
ncbi:hypothetical protein KIH39_23135 [Telmatocola sphagniphila]|uniref:Uncharacterized protein n=1 Tax=Telmatocola sphagniphila TaxID=1123043 RepID=A0A8E6EXJ8_9BACT|nr:hypothetical protein [Telmatocola sphagniphila]QVL31703.1 hypothetical protein KIH39_23135 [Telmatocola sphagniphila]